MFKSSCSLFESVLLAIRLNYFVSSAKAAIVDEDTASGRSLTAMVEVRLKPVE